MMKIVGNKKIRRKKKRTFQKRMVELFLNKNWKVVQLPDCLIQLNLRVSH